MKIIENKKYRTFIKRIGLTISIVVIIYGSICLIGQKIEFSNYNLTWDYYENNGRHCQLGDMVNRGKAIESCEKELKDRYLNNTSYSQSILKYKSCELNFNSDNVLDNNSHYANLKVDFDIQDWGMFFFPINFLKNDREISIVQTIELKKYISTDTKEKVNTNNSSNYHNGDIITISASDAKSKNYSLKGVVIHINTDSIDVDFEDASIDYGNLKFDAASLNKIEK